MMMTSIATQVPHRAMLTFLLVMSLLFTSKPNYEVYQPDQSEPSHVVQLYGNLSLGYYYAQLYFGSPAQPQSVIIDTGSGMLAIPCSKCQSCSSQHIHPYFNLSRTRTHKIYTCASNDQVCKQSCNTLADDITEPCRFSMYFSQGSSLQGIYIEDYVSLNKTHQDQFEQEEQIMSRQLTAPKKRNKGRIKIKFGCTTRETNLFLKQSANGIFGLAPNRSSLIERLFYSQYSQNSQRLTFSICLRKDGGYLNVGGTQNVFHNRNQKPITMKYLQGAHIYSLPQIGDIHVGGTIFHSKGEYVGSYGIFLDSGSTYTFFPKKQFDRFADKLHQQCSNSPFCSRAKGDGNNLCYHIAQQNMQIGKFQRFVGSSNQSELQLQIQQIFSPIVMEIGEQKLLWRPTEYFLLRDLTNRQVCIGIISSKDKFVLGANWMINKDIVLNVKKHTVEIYPDSHCSFEPVSSMKQQQQSSIKFFSENNKIRMENSSRNRMSNMYSAVNGKKPLTYLSAKFQVKNKFLAVLGSLFTLAATVFFYFNFIKRPSLKISHIDDEKLPLKSCQKNSINQDPNHLQYKKRMAFQ